MGFNPPWAVIFPFLACFPSKFRVNSLSLEDPNPPSPRRQNPGSNPGHTDGATFLLFFQGKRQHLYKDIIRHPDFIQCQYDLNKKS